MSVSERSARTPSVLMGGVNSMVLSCKAMLRLPALLTITSKIVTMVVFWGTALHVQFKHIIIIILIR
jgi:hypothetical protein